MPQTALGIHYVSLHTLSFKHHCFTQLNEVCGYYVWILKWVNSKPTLLASWIFPNIKLQITEAYSELCQTFKIEYFTKKVKSFKPLTFFCKHFILDIWHGSEYTSGLLKLLCCGSKRDTWEHLIYAKLIIVFTLNLAFSLYSEVIHWVTKLKPPKV